MSTTSVDVMLSKPGIYLVLGRPVHMFFVEVENGVCYQLDPTFTRDGVLYPGGWNINVIVGIYGPIPAHSRQAATDPASPAESGSDRA